MRILLFCFLVINLSAVANHNCRFMNEFNEVNHHRIYGGPELFYFDLKCRVEEFTIQGPKVFGGLRLGYEYLRPKFFYFGIEGFSSASVNNLKISLGEASQELGNIGFGNLDLRLGYTFFNKLGLFTPFLGMGGYSFGRWREDTGIKETLLYYQAGLRSRYEISPFFNAGLNFKLFHTADRRIKFKNKEIDITENANIWGGEIGLPLFWIVPCPAWDLELEPYFLYFNTRHSQNIYGLRLLFGYRF